MKAEILKKNKKKITMAGGMNPGEIGRIMEGRHVDHLVLGIYGGIVSLNDPSLTWTEGSGVNIELLPSGTQVVLTVE